jgi:hypothetical protein
VSLRGTLETFALTDVLSLVASTTKTGELQVSGEGTTGRVWLDAGRIVGARAGDVTDPAEVVYRLLRLDTGEFSFETDAAPEGEPTEPHEVDGVVATAQTRLAEWREIQQVVPSLEAVVTLASPAPSESVTMTAEQWAVVAAVGDGRSVENLMERLDQDELAAGRLVKGLVEAGLVTVAVTPKPASGRAPERRFEPKSSEPEAEAEPDPEPEVQPASAVVDRSLGRSKSRAADPGKPDLVRQLASLNESTYKVTVPDDAEHPVEPASAKVRADEGGTSDPDTPVPASAAAAEGDEAVNRGMLLKFLSSVRS